MRVPRSPRRANANDAPPEDDGVVVLDLCKALAKWPTVGWRRRLAAQSERKLDHLWLVSLTPECCKPGSDPLSLTGVCA